MKTLFDLDLKAAIKNPNFKPGVMNNIMVARKDAHFFDFSRGISGSLISSFLAYNNDADIPLARPPVNKALLRFNFTDTSLFLHKESYGRLNSVLVCGSKYYFFQQTTEGDMKLYPFVLDSDLAGKDFSHSASYIDGQVIPTKDLKNYEPGPQYSVITIGANQQREDFEKDAKAVFGFMGLVHLAFAALYETKALTVTREQIEQPWSSPKNPAFYTKTTLVKIAMSRVRNKYLKRSEPTGRKMPWGEVRSHFAHWRVTDQDCQHQWHDRTGEGRKFKCDKCGEIKTLRTFPTGRGNKDIGIIKTNYEVSQT